MGISVLIVDDDPAFRALVGDLLRAQTLTVAGEAASCAEALACAERARPQAILVDVHLPDGDGAALAGRLSALPWRPRVVLTSGDPGALSARLVERSGALAFVPKGELGTAGLSALLRGDAD